MSIKYLGIGLYLHNRIRSLLKGNVVNIDASR